jgi:hypothetical protein
MRRLAVEGEDARTGEIRVAGVVHMIEWFS